MYYWIAIAAISWWGITEVVKTVTKHHHNLVRLKMGYTTKGGDIPGDITGYEKPAECIDLTQQNENYHGNEPYNEAYNKAFKP